MLLNIAPSNEGRVKAAVTAAKIEAAAGYTACYRVISGTIEYEVWELARPSYPLHIIKTRNGSDIYYITFGEITENTISVYSAEILKNGNPNDTRTEKAERYLKKYSQLACALHGLVTGGILAEAEELEAVKVDGFYLEQYKPAPGLYRWRIRTEQGEYITRGQETKADCIRAAIEKAEDYINHPERYPKARENAPTVSELVLKAFKGLQEEPKEAPQEAPQTTEAAPALYKYGMKYRGFSIGAQPAGVVEREDDHTGKYYDIISYNRALSAEELRNYELTPLEAPQSAETVTATETTTEAQEAPQSATEAPRKRRTAYKVECRSPRGSWTAYSEEQPTHEAAEAIKAEAEERHTMTADGAPVFYRVVQIDKGPAEPQEAPTANGSHAGKEETTGAENAPQRATESATETPATLPADSNAQKAPERAESAEAVQSTTAPQTEPPRATDAATTGDRGQTTTAERSERRKRYLRRMIDELARKRRKARREAKETTGRTTAETTAGQTDSRTGSGAPAGADSRTDSPGATRGQSAETGRKACQSAPGRTEPQQAAQVPTGATKSPPRGKAAAEYRRKVLLFPQVLWKGTG